MVIRAIIIAFVLAGALATEPQRGSNSRERLRRHPSHHGQGLLSSSSGSLDSEPQPEEYSPLRRGMRSNVSPTNEHRQRGQTLEFQPLTSGLTRRYGARRSASAGHIGAGTTEMERPQTGFFRPVESTGARPGQRRVASDPAITYHDQSSTGRGYQRQSQQDIETVNVQENQNDDLGAFRRSYLNDPVMRALQEAAAELSNEQAQQQVPPLQEAQRHTEQELQDLVDQSQDGINRILRNNPGLRMNREPSFHRWLGHQQYE
ncbi:hypothetical protein MIR68_006300 [Amoeboaphelidium protococcarum]|nr:hypothetical protein MIR68_006300 [Amoeboaphelidium protococcarum]